MARDPEFPVIPPPDFVAMVNATAVPTGRMRTSFDPLVALLWHTVTAPSSQQPLVITKI
jgi:hypothetical protein